MSKLKVIIVLEDEPQTVIDDFIISEEEFEEGIWKEDALRAIQGAITWEILTRKKPKG